MPPRSFLHFAAFMPLFAIMALPAAAQTPEGGQSAPPGVQVETVRTTEITRSDSFNGRVESREKIDILARVEGYLKPLLFEEGTRVEKGAPLFEIEDDLYIAQVDAAKAELASAIASRSLAKIERDRSAELVQRSAVAQSQLDTDQAEYEQAEAAVQQARAELKVAEINLSYTKIFAPATGRIGKASASQGGLVGPSSGALAQLVATDPIDVVWPIPSREWAEIRTEHRDPRDALLRIRLPNGREYEHTGEIAYAEPSANASTNTISVRGRFPNPDGLLVDGQLVRVQVESRTSTRRLTAPQSALLLDQEGGYMLVVDDDDVAQKRPVRTGDQIGADVVILDGLEEGDRVIVAGLQKVRPGMKVAPVAVETAARNGTTAGDEADGGASGQSAQENGGSR